tara:strand:- start:359 stop:466 length:108 start_codon:yes stop_codon:yes gene_type:complete
MISTSPEIRLRKNLDGKLKLLDVAYMLKQETTQNI